MRIRAFLKQRLKRVARPIARGARKLSSALWRLSHKKCPFCGQRRYVVYATIWQDLGVNGTQTRICSRCNRIID